MSVILEALAIGVVTVAALVFLGYGLTGLLLPRALSAEGLLWTPFVGYTVASIVYHALNVPLLDGRRTTVVLFAVGAAMFGLAVVRSRPVSAPPTRVCVALIVISLVVFLVGVGPLAAIGQLTAISVNHDLIDIYDATAAYVIDYPVVSIVSSSPPNPLARLITGPIVLSNGWGLSYVHAMASILTARSTIETQTPVFGLMDALLVPAMFIFLRRATALPTWLALATGSALGLHGMLLSILFIGLGNHTAILGLLPVIFTSTFLALDERRPQSIAFAGLMLANLPLTYWAAFAFYVPPVLVYAVLGPLWPFLTRATHPTLWPRVATRVRCALGRGVSRFI
jgi:hypothetical protein